MTNTGTPNKGQMSQLPGLTHYITGHDQKGRAIIQQEKPAEWREFGGSQTSLHEIYATSGFPPNLNKDADIAESNKILSSPDLGLVHPGGIVCRIVDFAPGNDLFMHRTRSLVYGVVLEGKVEMVLDSGDVRVLQRGNVVVQRGTMHAWKNPSKTEWTRLAFFMQSSEPLEVGNTVLRENFGGNVPDQ